ncbi:MAG: hypothetical protein NTW96_03380 [Planctomycetia bacterium]|nr:hypothetical protein [Planctomycetia bacterium]
MLRDLQQLSDAPPFGVTAVEGFLTVEGLLQEALRYVPYCDEHRNVWSSHFARIILDAASQVDSIWKATAKIDDPARSGDRLTIKSHFDRFGPLVAGQEVIFFSGVSPRIGPFGEWRHSDFAPPRWWKAYNRLKHDRLSNQKDATLDHAVNAVGALLLAVTYSGSCDVALINAGLLDASAKYVWNSRETRHLRDVTSDCAAKLETGLFAHPLGVFGVDNCRLPGYWMSASPRFNVWWLQYVIQRREGSAD